MLPVGTMLTAVGELGTAVEHPSLFPVRLAGGRAGGRDGGMAPHCLVAAVPPGRLPASPPPRHLHLPASCWATQGAVRKGGRMLVLREPRGGPFLLSRQPLPELVASLQASAVSCQQWGAAFTTVGASMLVAAAAQHAATWLRERRIRARVQKALAQRRAAAAAAGATADRQPGQNGAPALAGAAGGEADADDGGSGGGDGIARGLCVICLERQPETVFPCGHLCACERCGGGLQRCPICRTRGRPIRVYHP